MIDEKTEEALTFYLKPGPMTDAGATELLPGGQVLDIARLRDIVQGLMVHIFWAQRYGLGLSETRQAEVQLRRVSEKLACIQALDPRPLDQARPLETRLVGNCRDFTVLMVTLLRAQGIPARARCGFGRYFLPGHFEDHWVAEYWDRVAGRWVLVDAQLDGLMIERLQVAFDPLDLPAGAFVNGAEAWKLCRDGQADPDAFGIFEFKGWDFVRGNLVRDLLALNRVEVLPWDFWGVLTRSLAESGEAVWQACDRMAGAILQAGESPQEARRLYEECLELHPPREWLEG